MDRWACVDLPRLLLQLVWRREPALRASALAVVEQETCHAPLRQVSAAALRLGVREGMRTPAACALCPGLEIRTVAPDEKEEGSEEAAAILRSFSPRLESLPLAGCFLLDPSGLERLFGTERQWGDRIVAALADAGFQARLALASSRFAAIAMARGLPEGRTAILRTREEEEARLRTLPLRVLGLSPEHHDVLDRLGVRTVGAFLGLPAGAMARRFGEDLARLRRALEGDDPTPLQPQRPEAPCEVVVEVEPPDDDVARLLFLARRHLVPLLARLAAAGRALGALHLTLRQAHRAGDGASSAPAVLRPATPCLDDRLLSDLVRLHLDALRLVEPVEMIVLRAEAVPASNEQLALFAGRAAGSTEAVGRAIARVRAAYGPDSVVQARLADTHRPEAAYRWVPLERLPELDAAAADRTPPPATAVRAFRPTPQELRFGLLGTLTPVAGPHLLEGGWWDEPTRRRYHFVRTRGGDLWWVYHDPDEDRWFLQGTV